MKQTIQRTYELLEENGYTEEDLSNLHNKVIQNLEDKMMVVAGSVASSLKSNFSS